MLGMHKLNFCGQLHDYPLSTDILYMNEAKQCTWWVNQTRMRYLQGQIRIIITMIIAINELDINNTMRLSNTTAIQRTE